MGSPIRRAYFVGRLQSILVPWFRTEWQPKAISELPRHGEQGPSHIARPKDFAVISNDIDVYVVSEHIVRSRECVGESGRAMQMPLHAIA